jgi:hypothetical protein
MYVCMYAEGGDMHAQVRIYNYNTILYIYMYVCMYYNTLYILYTL